MHKQRLAVIIAAALGVVSAFMPWAKVAFFGMSVSAKGTDGGDGFLTIALFAVAGIFAFLGTDRTKAIDASKVKVVAIMGAIITGFMLLELLFFIGFSYSGIGVYLSLIAGFGVLAIPFVIKDTGEISMPTADSVKDEFNEMRNN
jgi:hypothetical protein